MIDTLNEQLKPLSLEERVALIKSTFGEDVALSSSLGVEDQLLTALFAQVPQGKIFTLDTGRLYTQTYELLTQTEQQFNVKIDCYFPSHTDIEQYVSSRGINGFYESVEARKECCYVRKILPLKRALTGLKAWVTGLRREQSPTRKGMALVEWDETFELIKINPLLDWTEQEVWNEIKKRNIPYNVLHNQGFPSIGCAPCTRAIEEGEDIRHGRWWWENPEHKECGLHRRKL